MALRFAACGLGLALLAGCVSVPEFRELEREVVQLQRGGPGGGGERLAELGREVAELRDELNRLQGEVEEARHAAKQAMAEARRLRPAAGAIAASEDVAPAQSGGAAKLLVGSLSEEDRSYEQAFALYRKREYAAAIDRFEAFLQTHASSGFSDNAQFWLGVCHFNLGDFEKAVLAFDDVVKRYPDGNKVPDALYRQGVALLEIGKSTAREEAYRPAARQIFEELVRDHPDSERVAETRIQLEKLRR